MRSRKVFRIYAALPDEERKAFGTYLASPFFNNSQRLIDFRQLLEEELVQNPGQKWAGEEVWSKLPKINTEYRANGFDKLCAELFACLNDFLAVQAFRSHAATVGSYQMEAYVDHQLDEWVPSVFEGLLEKLGKNLERDPEGLYAHLQMLENYGEYLFRQPRMPHGDALMRIDEQLNLFFIAKKLEMAATVDAYNATFNGELSLPYLSIIKEEVEKVMDSFPLLLRLRALAWLLTSTRRDQHYWELKSLLLFTHREIAAEEARPIFQTALNHCTFRINLNQREFEQEADTLMVTMLMNGVLLVEGKLPPEQMKNIVSLRLMLGQTDWVVKFLETWQNKLTNDHGGCALIYNQAVLAFYQERFTDCVKGMETVLREFKEDIYYGPSARIYQLMSLFEIGKAENTIKELDTRIHALRMFLTRENRIGEVAKERYLNLVKQFRKLVALASEPERIKKSKADKFLQDLKSLNPVSNRDWFLKQVEELQAR